MYLVHLDYQSFCAGEVGITSEYPSSKCGIGAVCPHMSLALSPMDLSGSFSGLLQEGASVAALVSCKIRDKPCVMQVNTDVQIVLEALGLADSKDAEKEGAALKDVSDILKLHMGATWVTGNPNNKT